jgi:hypothetical protein
MNIFEKTMETETELGVIIEILLLHHGKKGVKGDINYNYSE